MRPTVYQVHKYDPKLLKPLAHLSTVDSYGRALEQMEEQKRKIPEFCELCIVDSELVHEDDTGIIWRSVPCLFVVLEAVRNPDHGQYGTLIPRHTVAARDIPHASELCMAFIDRHGLGGGNWSGGDITDNAGRAVGKVSYNGKVWEPGTRRPGDAPIYPTPKIPVTPPSPPPAPLFAANEERGVEVFAKGDTVVETFRGPGSVTYKVVDISKSGVKLTLHEPGHEGLVYAHRDRTGKYRVKDGGFIHKQRAS